MLFHGRYRIQCIIKEIISWRTKKCKTLYFKDADTQRERRLKIDEIVCVCAYEEPSIPWHGGQVIESGICDWVAIGLTSGFAVAGLIVPSTGDFTVKGISASSSTMLLLCVLIGVCIRSVVFVIVVGATVGTFVVKCT